MLINTLYYNIIDYFYKIALNWQSRGRGFESHLLHLKIKGLQHLLDVGAFYIYSVPLSGIELIKFYFSICVAAAESKNNFALGCLRNIEAGQFSEMGPFKA